MTKEAKHILTNVLLSLLVAVTGAFFTVQFTGVREDRKEIEDAIASKADLEYVDQEIKAIGEYVDQENTKQDDVLNQRLAERDKVNQIILQELKYIKERIDKIPIQ